MSTYQDVLFSIHDGHGRIVLNRPAALNALTLEMIDAISAQLAGWEMRADIRAIVITGAGDKAFCAGGDVRALYDAKQRGDLGYLEDFYRREYALNYRLATYKKPIIAVMDGIVMGGGAGVALNCSHPVATHKTLFAMPECRIGLIPDVGAGHFLNKARPAVALAIGLVGLSLRGPGLIKTGLVSHFIGSGRVDEIRFETLESLQLQVEAAGIEELLPLIEPVFGLGSLDEIVTVLAARRDAWAVETYKALRAMSPTALRIAHAHLTRARGQDLAEILKTEFRLVQHLMAQPDFFEGVRAQIVDKDQTPKWQPATLAEVSKERIEACFGPVPGIKDWAPGKG